MAVENIPVAGFNVPPAGPGVNERGLPPPTNQQNPGWVAPPAAPAPAAGPTAAEIQAQVDAAIKAATPAPPAPAPVAQPAPDLSVDKGTDPVLTSLTSIFTGTAQGIDINRAIGNALARGDASLIDTAYINEKGGAQADQLNVIAKAIVDRVATQTNAAVDAVHVAAGGEAQWNVAASAFDQQAPKHLKVVIANLLQSGDPESIRAGAQTVIDYVKNNGLVVNPAQLVQAGAAGLGGAQGMSKAEFQEALRKLEPNSRTYTTDREALFARRVVGKQLGK